MKFAVDIESHLGSIKTCIRLTAQFSATFLYCFQVGCTHYISTESLRTWRSRVEAMVLEHIDVERVNFSEVVLSLVANCI